MKYYVLTLLLVVGLVSSASAGNVDSRLFGTWTSYDGPCSPCVLGIQSGGVTFTQVKDRVDVIQAVGTRGPGIHMFLQAGGELDLQITKKSNRLVGSYSNYSGSSSNNPVVFDLKE